MDPTERSQSSVALFRHLHAVGAVGRMRTAMHDNREHVVVPVVALFESVVHAINAQEPEFVPLSCLACAPQGWNGRPVVLGHPVNSAGQQISANTPDVLASQAFGSVFGARIDGNRLVMDAWIDPQKAVRVGATRMLQRLGEGEPVEVSVGAFVRTDRTSGVHEGKTYKAKWIEVTPDHLAFLTTGVGACSVAAGCGARVGSTHLATAGAFPMTEYDDIDPLDGYAIGLRRRAEEERRGTGQPAVPRAAEQHTANARLQGMAEFRQSFYETMFSNRPAETTRTLEDFDYTPPDPYRAALEERRQREGR